MMRASGEGVRNQREFLPKLQKCQICTNIPAPNCDTLCTITLDWNNKVLI